MWREFFFFFPPKGRWEHTIHIPLYLTFQEFILGIISYLSICLSVYLPFLFLQLYSISLYEHARINLTPNDGYLSSFQILPIIHNAAVNVLVSLRSRVSLSIGQVAGSGIFGSQTECLQWMDTAQLPFEGLYSISMALRIL